MSCKSTKYRLFILGLITTSLLLVYLYVCAFGQKGRSDNALAEMESAEGVVPPSQPPIPAELTNRAQTRAQEFLKFFKTPMQQFIPLGFYGMTTGDLRNTDALSRLRKRGIILFHKAFSEQPLQNALEDLQSARKAGVAILQNLPRKFLFTRKRNFWQYHISGLAPNDQILVWYLPEEIKAQNLNKLEMISNIIRATDDKNRPIITYVVKWREDYLKRVNSMVDALVFGFYPCHNGVRPRIEIKRRIDHAHKCGVLTVIAVLEALKGKRRWVRPEEIRFDAYLALISGAKGIMWYSYNRARQRPQLLEAVLDVATELNGPHRLGEVLLLGKQPEWLTCKMVKGPNYWHDDCIYGTTTKKPTKIHSIQWTAREYGTYLYIFAVNAAQKTIRPFVVDPNINGGPEYKVTASFGPINSPSSEVRVISEGRTVELSDGYFIDSFESLGTHVYEVRINQR
jgi:hypothetical protein